MCKGSERYSMQHFSKNKTKQNKKTAEDLAPAETAWTYNYLPWITSILLMDLCLFVCLQ